MEGNDVGIQDTEPEGGGMNKVEAAKAAGYRLLGEDEEMLGGDVCGWKRKYPVDMENWSGQRAGNFNQPVFRPLASFVDACQETGVQGSEEEREARREKALLSICRKFATFLACVAFDKGCSEYHAELKGVNEGKVEKGDWDVTVKRTDV